MPTMPPRSLTEVSPEDVDLDRLPPTLSTAEAAHLLGCHPVTVRRMLREGTLRSVRFDRHWRVPRAEVRRVLGVDREPTAQP